MQYLILLAFILSFSALNKCYFYCKQQMFSSRAAMLFCFNKPLLLLLDMARICMPPWWAGAHGHTHCQDGLVLMDICTAMMGLCSQTCMLPWWVHAHGYAPVHDGLVLMDMLVAMMGWHWMGCRVGQVVSLLGGPGPWHYGSHSELLMTAIRDVSWVNGPYLTTGLFSGRSGFLPLLKTMKKY